MMSQPTRIRFAKCVLLFSMSGVSAVVSSALTPVFAGQPDKPVAKVTRPIPMAPEEQERVAVILQQLQDAIEADSRLDGVIVWEVQLHGGAKNANDQFVMGGRVVSEEQQAMIVKAMSDLMRRDRYWWSRPKRLQIVANAMKVGPSDAKLAVQFRAQGLEAFWDGKYDEADTLFARAIAESPKDDSLRYWRVITAIALEQDERAVKKLKPLLRRNPQGSRTAVVAHSLERLQGKFRKKLIELEKQALITTPGTR